MLLSESVQGFLHPRRICQGGNWSCQRVTPAIHPHKPSAKTTQAPSAACFANAKPKPQQPAEAETDQEVPYSSRECDFSLGSGNWGETQRNCNFMAPLHLRTETSYGPTGYPHPFEVHRNALRLDCTAQVQEHGINTTRKVDFCPCSATPTASC